MRRSSYWHTLRLIFVLFFLYLMGDAFSRWDGFSHYASFSEFLPSVALASILWSITAVLTTTIVWVLLIAVVWFCQKIGLKIRIEHLLLYSGVFILLGALVWKGKKVLWPNVETALQIKVAVFICVVFITVVFIVFSRSRAEKWLNVIQERITPLVWMFGIFIFLSVPLVSYHAWVKDTGRKMSQLPGQQHNAEIKRPNIILVTFDAFAASRMSLYGYHRDTTPFIKKWAEQATVFTSAEAESNFTASTTASLMTGKRVWTHQTYHIEGSKPKRSDTESMPAVLKNHGYYNMAFVVNPFASVRILGMEDSFDIAPFATEFGASTSLFGWKFGIVDRIMYRAFGDKIKLHNWILKNDFIFSKVLNLISRNIVQTPVPPENAFKRFMEHVDENIPTPFFVWIHLFPPHDPYLPPEPFKNAFNASPELRSYKKQEKLIEDSYRYLFQYQAVPEEMRYQIDLMGDYYDEFIKFIDKAFEEFIEQVNARKMDNTVIVLSADHGESFKHGYLTHGGPFMYEDVTHIPLIIKKPGQVDGRIVDVLVEQIDIPATVLDLADIQVPSWMEGSSLMPLIRGKAVVPKPVFSMNLESNPSLGYKITTGTIAVWEGDYKLIHYLENGESLLFNLKKDPEEQDNLFISNPSVGQGLLNLIIDNVKKANESINREKS